MVAEESYRLDDDAGVAFLLEGFQGLFDGGADPGAAADALALEGEVPVGLAEADDREALGDQAGGALGLDGIGVGAGGDGAVLAGGGGHAGAS